MGGLARRCRAWSIGRRSLAARASAGPEEENRMASYYLTIKGKQYDRRLYEAALEAVQGQGDGRIGRSDAEKLLEKVLDASPGQADTYTEVEKRTVALLRQTMRWTPAADRHFRSEIRGAAARRAWEVRAQHAQGATTGTASALFPSETKFPNALQGVQFPADVDAAAIEEEAHVLSYTTASGENYCELWWAGGDAGTPLLAYLVDDEGAHPLPKLSQPKANGEPPFEDLMQAKQRFLQLAEAHYAAAGDAALDVDAVLAEVMSELGLEQMELKIPAVEVAGQIADFGGTVGFEEALRAALHSYLNDGTHVESPLETVRMYIEETGPLDGNIEDPKAGVVAFMNRPTSRLSLVRRQDYEAEATESWDFVMPPNHDEQLAPNWIFKLDINELSDHLHWALVDREGNKPTKNYGFN